MPVIAVLAGIAASSLVFGGALKLGDLLDEHGYSWFRYGEAVIAVAVFFSGVATLWLSGVAGVTFWLAVMTSWFARGRVDSLNHGLPVTGLLAVAIYAARPLEASWFIYFASTFVAAGLIHDYYQYIVDSDSILSRFFYGNQYLYWYLIPVGFWLLFEFHLELLVTSYFFVQGYSFFYSDRSRELMEKAGFEKD